MKVAIALAIASVSLGGAQVARDAAVQLRKDVAADEPFAPSPSAAPFISLGYRELLADLLFIRLAGYFGGEHPTPNAIAELAEATAAADPYFKRIYDYGARAMMVVAPADNVVPYAKRAIAMYDAGAQRFPTEYKFPLEAGQIYLFDLTSKDAAEQRAWQERGLRLVEKAIRMPGAPASSATYVAELRSKLGQHQRAVDDLREMFLTTKDELAQQRILEKLSKLSKDNAEALAAEVLLLREQFENEWKAKRPVVTPTWFVLLGAPLPKHFDMTELATGGRDLAGAIDTEELLEPLD